MTFRSIQLADNVKLVSFAGVTLVAWLSLVTVFGGFSYVDALRSGMDAAITRAVALYALGFAPWLFLGPAVFALARQQVTKKQSRLMALSEAAVIFTAAFGAIFLYFVFFYAPVMGMSASEAVSKTRLLQWSPDIFIFIIVFLTGQRAAQEDERGRSLRDARSNMRIAVRSQGRVDYILIDDIAAGSAQGNYVALQTGEGERLFRGMISDLAERLAPYGLVRAHRSHLVRPDCVVAAKTKGGAIRSVCLDSGAEIPVSAQYEPSLRQSLRKAVIHTD